MIPCNFPTKLSAPKTVDIEKTIEISCLWSYVYGRGRIFILLIKKSYWLFAITILKMTTILIECDRKKRGRFIVLM